MAVKLLFNELPQFVDANGDPYSGAKLFTYVAGSSTKQTTYQDSGAITANSNPIVCDSAGRVPYPIWGTTGVSYKLVLAPSTDTDPPTSPIFTIDNVTGINDTSVSIDEWVSGPSPTYVSAASFTLVGDQTSTFTIGRRVKTTNSGGTVYGTITASAFSVLTAITVKTDSGSLDSGLSAVSYGLISASHPATSAATINAQPVCNGRLTLTSGTAVTTSDVTAATTVYFTPFGGNTIDLYDGSANWNRYTFSELSVAVPATTVTMYDVFVYNNAGTLTLDATAWTNDTTRATALTTQNGVLVKSGATGRRYLGSFRTTGVSGQTEDSAAKRYVWNYYNRRLRPMRAVDTTNSWTYTTNSYRQANASTANQLDMVVGVSEDQVSAYVVGLGSNDNAGVGLLVGVGLDSTSALASGCLVGQYTCPSNGTVGSPNAQWKGFVGVGRHYLAWLEYSVSVGTTTWLGDAGGTIEQSGIHGEIWA